VGASWACMRATKSVLSSQKPKPILIPPVTTDFQGSLSFAFRDPQHPTSMLKRWRLNYSRSHTDAPSSIGRLNKCDSFINLCCGIKLEMAEGVWHCTSRPQGWMYSVMTPACLEYIGYGHSPLIFSGTYVRRTSGRSEEVKAAPGHQRISS
jgi:hypothetical protein